MKRLDNLLIMSQFGSYAVKFADTIDDGASGLDTLAELMVVVDSEVLRNHRDALAPLTTQFPTFVVNANEHAKTLDSVCALVDWLLDNKAVRSTTLVAVGGGCIQDLVSFTAHIYYRGIDWIFLPTTVLSQSDSCIGAKSGINRLPLKNPLGVLHPPREIRIVKEFLKSLPAIETQSGYGEIVKLSVTSSRFFLDNLEASLAAHGLNSPNLLELERASLLAKQEIIEEDESEQDLRRVLNYGHSFGHALEVVSGHTVPHGIAVLWGIDVINALGVRWGITPKFLASRIHTLISNNFDYLLDHRIEAESLVDIVSRDKKVAHGLMNFVVLRQLGELSIEPRKLDATLVSELREVLAGNRVFAGS